MLEQDPEKLASSERHTEEEAPDGGNSTGDRGRDGELGAAESSRPRRWIPLAYELGSYAADGSESRREVF